MKLKIKVLAGPPPTIRQTCQIPMGTVFTSDPWPDRGVVQGPFLKLRGRSDGTKWILCLTSLVVFDRDKFFNYQDYDSAILELSNSDLNDLDDEDGRE